VASNPSFPEKAAKGEVSLRALKSDYNVALAGLRIGPDSINGEYDGGPGNGLGVNVERRAIVALLGQEGLQNDPLA
jgi:hypothetical protein